MISGGSAFVGDAGIHAFLWEKGSMTDLGSLDGSGGSVATGINAAGAIVGYALGPGITHENDVQSMLAVFWDGGQIAGVGLNPDGAVRGFILTPAAG